MNSGAKQNPWRVMAFMEALTVTGPAKNLISFARHARTLSPAIEHCIVTFRRPGQPASDPFLEAAAATGIAVHILQESGPADPRLPFAIGKLIRQTNPTFVQTHNVKSSFLVSCTGLTRRYPWLAFHHGYTQVSRKQRMYDLLDRWSLPRAHRVVAVTKAFRPELQAAGVREEQIRIAGNAIALPAQSVVLQPWPAEPLILSVGRLAREKGHADLLSALEEVQPPCRLLFVGDGPERPELLAGARRLRQPVDFAGQVNDVWPYYAQAQVFVLPSWSEGAPNALLEAMGAGLPIVATDVGGVSEIVERDREALLVPPREPKALAAALVRVLSDPQLAARLGAAARRRAELDFGELARAQKLLSIYEELWKQWR